MFKCEGGYAFSFIPAVFTKKIIVPIYGVEFVGMHLSYVFYYLYTIIFYSVPGDSKGVGLGNVCAC